MLPSWAFNHLTFSAKEPICKYPEDTLDPLTVFSLWSLSVEEMDILLPALYKMKQITCSTFWPLKMMHFTHSNPSKLAARFLTRTWTLENLMNRQKYFFTCMFIEISIRVTNLLDQTLFFFCLRNKGMVLLLNTEVWARDSCCIKYLLY